MINVGKISLLEFVTQNTGSAFSLVSYAIENQLEISDQLLPGQRINESSFEQVEKDSFSDVFASLFKQKSDVTIVSGQSLLDLSIQQMGSPFLFIDAAIKNEISLDALLTVGNKLIIPDFEENETSRYFKANQKQVATYFTTEIPKPSSLTYELPGEFPYSF
jgi:hypothetical protein